jgi:succinoglycan biosynthesis protein ExoM
VVDLEKRVGGGKKGIRVSHVALISVCVCTFRRPDGLAALLRGLAEQKDTGGEFEVVVVDNDAAGSARTIMTRAQKLFPALPIRYAIEPRQNIALARNLTVRLASGRYLAFIDDDETPSPDWLGRMYSTLQAQAADAVFGPVIPVLPDGAPSWFRRGRFLERARHGTGECVPIAEARTGNAVIRAERINNRARPFDPAFGLTGGEDYDFFNALFQEGGHFIWCDEAIVFEHLSRERTGLRWLLRRSLRGGQVYALRQIIREGKAASLGLVVRGVAACVLALLFFPLTLPFGIHHAISWLLKGASGLGKLLAFTSYRYEEYRV